jgi:hypothetical protein
MNIKSNCDLCSHGLVRNVLITGLRPVPRVARTDGTVPAQRVEIVLSTVDKSSPTARTGLSNVQFRLGVGKLFRLGALPVERVNSKP